MNNKTMLGGLAGGVVFFLLGWLIYGMLLMDYFDGHTMAGLNKSESEMMGGMIWMILSNLVWGYLYAVIFSWSGVTTLSQGAQRGAVIGLLTSVGIDLGYYAMSNMYDAMGPYIVDIIAISVMSTISGAAVAWMMNRKTAAA